MKKLTSIAKIATAATVTLGALSVSSAAHAINLVPQQEGEIGLKNNSFACLSDATCINTQPLGFSIESLDYNGKPASLLFSDIRNTANSYTTGGFGINFKGDTSVDEGTNTTLGQYWLRPVAVDSTGKPLEDGRLEVGRFKFDFLGKNMSEVVLNLFDVEYKNSTKVIKVNGVNQTLASLIAAAGPDSNVQTITLKDVKTFEIQLGKQGGSFGTGDGVALQGTAVPEPAANVSLGALGLAAMFGLNRRRKAVKFN